ncbi:unnamed protein product, partial [Allacma fusca]
KLNNWPERFLKIHPRKFSVSSGSGKNLQHLPFSDVKK